MAPGASEEEGGGMSDSIQNCACVHLDSVECARRRDNLMDDPTTEPRRCDCVCHSEDEDKSNFWEDGQ